MSNRHRNHTMMAAIQMKNQNDQRSTSPKSLVMASMGRPSLASGSGPPPTSPSSVPDEGLSSRDPGPPCRREAGLERALLLTSPRPGDGMALTPGLASGHEQW